MVFKVKYVNNAFPNHRASVGLFDGNGLGKRGCPAVLGFHARFNETKSAVKGAIP